MSSNADPPGMFARVTHEGGKVTAFVPAPLPPELPLTTELWNALSRADRALAQLAGWGREMANPNLFIRPFLRQEAVSSSKIEGTQADLADLYAYEAGQLSLDVGAGDGRRTPAADVQEVHNYVAALEYGIGRLQELPISRRLIRELHSRLMASVRGHGRSPGEFRKIQNWIGPPGSTLADAEYVPPPVPEMETALNDLETYLNQDGTYPPLVRIALSHYQFEAIHPFLDGNGRVGRLLITILLVHWGLVPVPLLYLSAFFQRRKDEYIGRLRDVSESGDWEAWILFFLEAIEVQATRGIRTAERLLHLKQAWHQQLTEAHASATLLNLINYLFERPVLSVPQAQRFLGLSSYGAARYNIDKLLERGIVIELPDTHPKLYAAIEVLQSVARPAEDE